MTDHWQTLDSSTHPGRGWWAQRCVTKDGRVLWFDIASNVLQFCYSDGVYIGSRKNILEARALCESGKREAYVMDNPVPTTEQQWKESKLKMTLKWEQVDKANWHAEPPEGEKLPPRIRSLDEKTFAVYRNAEYLGCEETLLLAQKRAVLNKRSERNRVMILWEHAHPGELPPYLLTTAEERDEYWRRHPPVRRSAPAVAAPKPKSEKRVALETEGGGTRTSTGMRAAKPKGDVPSGVLSLLNGTNPKKPGSSAAGRWALLFEHAGKGSTVAAFIEAGGNPETLGNAMAKGHVKVEGE